MLEKVITVDGTRPDFYNENGSSDLPYLKLQSAIDRIIANGDNSDDVMYRIDVVGPKNYAENLLLNNAKLKNVMIDGHGCASILPDSGNAIDCSSDNDEFHLLAIKGMTIGALNLVGAVDGGHTFVSDCNLEDCLQIGDVVAHNIVALTYVGAESAIHSENMDIHNVCVLGINGGVGIGGGPVTNLALTYNGSDPKPDAGDFLIAATTVAIAEKCVLNAAISIDANSYLQLREGVRASTGGGTLTVNGTLDAYSSFIRGTLSVGSSGTFLNKGSFYDPSLLSVAGGGTVDSSLSSVQVLSYVAGASGNWATSTPGNPVSALDRLAAAVAGLLGGPIP